MDQSFIHGAETGRERKRDGYRMLGRRMEKSKRSNLPVERGMSKKFFLGIYGVHPLGPRERERVNDGSCLISRRILGARGWKAVDEGQFATIMTIPRRLGELLPTFKALAESKWGLQVLRDEDT